VSSPAPDWPSADLVREALARVIDPESGLNIVDMGLVVAIDTAVEPVDVRLVMTSAACPMSDMIADDVEHELAQLLGDRRQACVTLVDDPPWTPDRLSEAARQQFGWDGRDADDD
jgi:metal-sulfur cluster biosynthetic enzyme